MTVVAVDSFANRLHELKTPLSDGFDVTPSDTNQLPFVTRAITVGVAGNLSVDMNDNRASHNTGPITLAVQPGFYWLRIKKVYAAGTTATGIAGLF